MFSTKNKSVDDFPYFQTLIKNISLDKAYIAKKKISYNVIQEGKKVTKRVI